MSPIGKRTGYVDSVGGGIAEAYPLHLGVLISVVNQRGRDVTVLLNPAEACTFAQLVRDAADQAVADVWPDGAA